MVTKITDKSGSDAVPSAEWNWLVDLIDGTGVASANLKWIQTSTTGNALSITRNLASGSTDSPVVYLENENASDDQGVLYIEQEAATVALSVVLNGGTSGSGAVNITQSAASTCKAGLMIASLADDYAARFRDVSVGTGSGTNSAFFVQGNTSTSSRTAWFYRNLAAAATSEPMVFIEQDNAGDDQPALMIQQDSSTLTAYGLRVDNNSSGSICALFAEGNDNYASIGRMPDNASGSHHFYRDLTSASTGGAVVFIEQDNAGDDQPALMIGQDCNTEAIKFSSGVVAFDFATAMASTGAGTMAVNNSPGAGTTTWIQVQVNNTTGYIPVHYAV